MDICHVVQLLEITYNPLIRLKKTNFIMTHILKNFKKIGLLTFLLMISMFKSHSQMIEGGTLEEVTITCKRFVAYKVDLVFINYVKYGIICNNGYEAYFDYFWY